MIIIQLLLFCLLFTGMVRIAVLGGAVNGLYFYPKPVQERAIGNGGLAFCADMDAGVKEARHLRPNSLGEQSLAKRLQRSIQQCVGWRM